MGAFLENLVARSLSTEVAVRPRPASLFEPIGKQPHMAGPGFAELDREEVFEWEERFRIQAPSRLGRDVASTGVRAAASSAVEAPGHEHGADDAPWPLSEEDERILARQDLLSAREKQDVRAPAAYGEPHASRPVRATAAPPRATHAPHVEPETPARIQTGAHTEQGRDGPAEIRPAAPVLRVATVRFAAEQSERLEAPAARPRQLPVPGRQAVRPSSERNENVPKTASPEHANDGESSVTETAVDSPSSGSPRLGILDAADRAEPRRALPPENHHREDVPLAQAMLTPRLPAQLVPRPVQQAAAKPAESVVHVTIGRVEVRAVQTASASKPAATQTPALSLSDYLQRRSRGRA